MKKACAWRINVRAATAIEYSLIAAGVAVTIATVVFTAGSDLTVLFDQVGTLAARFTTN